jgi:AAA+ ATPase superfamily predicted ATPase
MNCTNNPFIFGNATDGEMFTNRIADIERLSTNFRNGINTILISPRRWGKTSLVRKVSKLAMSNQLKLVNIDVFSCRTEEDFYRLFAVEVIKQTSSRWEEWIENAKKFLSSFVPKITIGVDPMADFSFSFDFADRKQSEEVLNLPQKIADEKGIKIVICIDEFQQITEFKNNIWFQKKLRSAWQLQNDVSYCLYGSKKHILGELFSRQNMPFYKFGDLIFLPKISTSDWIKFICERFKVTGKKITINLAEKICHTVENHSSYVQQFSWLVWLKTDFEASEDAFESAKSDLLNQNSALYYRYIEELTGYQINFLRAVADGNHKEFTKKDILKKYDLGTSANISRLKKSLENKELIDNTNGYIIFDDPVFRIWFLKNIY